MDFWKHVLILQILQHIIISVFSEQVWNVQIYAKIVEITIIV
jgi:hypothetical protein